MYETKKINIVIITTRLFGNQEDPKSEKYFFNLDKCETIDLNDGSCLVKFHTENINEYDINSILREKFNKIEEKDKLTFLEERRNKVGVMNHANIDSLKDMLEGLSENKDISINNCILFDGTDSPVSFQEIIENVPILNKIPSQLNLRGKIYKRKDKNIFGYRCLDLYDDIVEKDAREYFISSLVRDVAAYLLNKTCNDSDLLTKFFTNYQLTLVLHEEDIGFPRGFNKKLTNEELDQSLFMYNSDLKMHSNSINTYVFQHTSNIFVRYLTVFDDDLDANTLAVKFQNFSVNRTKFEENEENVFISKKPEENITNMKTIIREFANNNDKVY